MCVLKNFIILLTISKIDMTNPVGEWPSGEPNEDMPVVYGTIDDVIEQSRNRMLYGNNCGPNGCPDPPSTSFATQPSPPSTTAKTKRANILKIHCVIDNIAYPEKYNVPMDVSALSSLNPFWILIQWIQNLQEEC